LEDIISTFPTALEIIGLLAFSVSGVIAALQKHLDLMGIIVLAITTACGGGILRDILLQNGIPVFFTNYSYITTVIIAIIGTLVINKLYSRHKTLRKYNVSRILDVADAIGLATFGTSAALMVVDQGGNMLTCVFIWFSVCRSFSPARFMPLVVSRALLPCISSTMLVSFRANLSPPYVFALFLVFVFSAYLKGLACQKFNIMRSSDFLP